MHTAAAALMAIKNMHLFAVGGEAWYVDGGTGADTNSGSGPDNAFATIGAAITVCSAGDQIVVAAATYTEAGLDLNKNNVQMWFAIGSIIDPAAGTAFTVSGTYCWVYGELTITPAALATGLAISGANCVAGLIKVQQGGIGYLITGQGTVLNDCASGSQTTTAYDIQAAQGRLLRCKTVGIGATVGYKINGGVDTGVLENCTSVGHTTSGFQISTGSMDWTILNCSSGSGDGKAVDVDHGNVWSAFKFDDVLAKVITFAGAPTTYNLFEITGVVRVKDIYGIVETQIENTASTMYLQAFSTGGTVDVTDAPGLQVQNIVVGSEIVRNEITTSPLALAQPSAGPAIVESASFRAPKTEVDIAADPGATTYLRIVLSAALGSGVIHWHCMYEPLSDDGFMEVA